MLLNQVHLQVKILRILLEEDFQLKILFLLENDFIFNQKSYFNSTNTKHALSKDLNQLSVNYKRGTGGRSSFSGNVVTVFGCNGKIGRILLNRLGKEGFNIVAPYRGDDYLVRHLKLCADLGQINLFVIIMIFFS